MQKKSRKASVWKVLARATSRRHKIKFLTTHWSAGEDLCSIKLLNRSNRFLGWSVLNNEKMYSSCVTDGKISGILPSYSSPVTSRPQSRIFPLYNYNWLPTKNPVTLSYDPRFLKILRFLLSLDRRYRPSWPSPTWWMRYQDVLMRIRNSHRIQLVD